MIARTVVNRSPDVLTRLYKSLVRPLLECCVSAWSPHYVKDQSGKVGKGASPKSAVSTTFRDSI